MVSSLVPFIAATLGAVAMALAFPRTNAVGLAPLGAAALFWAWFGASPKRAFWVGWVAGTVYFSISFSWFGETAGALIAPFGFLLAFVPAVIEALVGFALVGAAVAFTARALAARERTLRAVVPLGAAALFACGEWFRGEGLGDVGVPFAHIGYTQATSPLAPIAAYAGVYGVSFAVCIIGAYLAYALRMRAVRGSGVDVIAALGTLAIVAGLAWAFWPARSLPPPTYRVAAIQGNIPQRLKFVPSALPEAIVRYTALTREAAATRPNLVVWPETVIPVAFNGSPALRAQFGALARTVGAEVVVGTYDVGDDGREYNVLAFFDRTGRLERSYRKSRLVPFAEHIPGRSLFTWIPWMANVSNFGEGSGDAIVRVGALRISPVICWESAFSGIVRGDVRDGADALIVATDDAWFGSSAGPYQHAQIAQMRAIETGRYIVRAASTGISGIIAPNGRYTRASTLGRIAIITGAIGPPAPTVFATVGSARVAFVLALVALAVIVRAERSARRAR